ncbi:MAG: ABC transporter permease subunit [Ardenticatenaceae bacterium]|nr:ABC transporter permease subunit [Ardenticatenaceae bacterium]
MRESSSAAGRKFIRQTFSLILILTMIAVVWEGVKLIGGDPWWPDSNPFGLEYKPPFRWKFASDLNLPHLWDIFGTFSQPARRNGPPLIEILVSAAFFTFREAVVGFAGGTLLGLSLGTLFAHIKIMEKGCMPYVVASQTVPILAIAPMVIIWLRAGWVSVAVISAYLTFFPVTINTLRGLQSPDPLAVDLLESYAASKWQILWKLRFPAALPYIFTALKVSATASIVGAIIGELPSGIRDGLGGAILNFNQYYISGPGRLWATILISAAVGILFFILIALAEWLVLRKRFRPVETV